MADAIKEIIDALRDRLRNPIFSAFVISWCTLNIRILVVLFSSEDLDHRLKLLDAEFASFWHWLKLPIAVGISILYVKYMPHVSKWAYAVQQKPKSEQRELQDQDEETRLKSELTLGELRQKVSTERAREITELTDREQGIVNTLAEKTGIANTTADLLFRNNVPNVERLAELHDWERAKIREIAGLEQIDQLTQAARETLERAITSDTVESKNNDDVREQVYEIVKQGLSLFEQRVDEASYSDWLKDLQNWTAEAVATIERVDSKLKAELFLESDRGKSLKTPGHSLGGTDHVEQLRKLNFRLDFLRREFNLQT